MEKRKNKAKVASTPEAHEVSALIKKWKLYHNPPLEAQAEIDRILSSVLSESGKSPIQARILATQIQAAARQVRYEQIEDALKNAAAYGLKQRRQYNKSLAGKKEATDRRNKQIINEAVKLQKKHKDWSRRSIAKRLTKQFDLSDESIRKIIAPAQKK